MCVRVFLLPERAPVASAFTILSSTLPHKESCGQDTHQKSSAECLFPKKIVCTP